MQYLRNAWSDFDPFFFYLFVFSSSVTYVKTEKMTFTPPPPPSGLKWAIENNMVLHDSKFDYLAYRTASSKLLEELPFTAQWVHYSTPSGQDLTPASSVKNLGVHLSPDMKWSLQATIAAQNANKMANWVLSVFSDTSDRSKNALLTLYKSIVHSRL